MNSGKNIIEVVENNDFEALKDILKNNPGKTRKLISRLHETNYQKLNSILRGFQVVAETLEREKLLDIVRRLMWMLNEESGNNCPNAALALGHIAQKDPQAIVPHLPVLKVYSEDPSSQMREPVRHAIAMIKMALTKTVYC